MGHKKSSSKDVSHIVAREYRSREFCRDVACRVQKVIDGSEKGSEQYEFAKNDCRTGCMYSTVTFMHWLKLHNYVVEGPDTDSACTARTAYDYHKWLQETGRRIVRRC